MTARFSHECFDRVGRTEYHRSVDWTRGSLAISGFEEWVTRLVSKHCANAQSVSSEIRRMTGTKRIDRVCLDANRGVVNLLIIDEVANERVCTGFAGELFVERAPERRRCANSATHYDCGNQRDEKELFHGMTVDCTRLDIVAWRHA